MLMHRPPLKTEYGMGTNSMTEGQKSGLIYGAREKTVPRGSCTPMRVLVSLSCLLSLRAALLDGVLMFGRLLRRLFAGALFFFFALFIAGYLLE